MSLVKSLLTLSICCVSVAASSESQVTESPTVTSGLAIETETCPSSFYKIQLPSGGKLCQVFAAELPASMIFHVPVSPQKVIDFYAQNDAMFSTSKQVKDRFMLQSNDKNTTLIISADGDGAQVDVLVKKS